MGIAIPRDEFGTPHQIEVLVDLEAYVTQVTEEHLERRNLWFPNELNAADEQLPPEHERQLQQMREAARGLPDVARVALALNLLTEEGLPHFHRLIATYLGSASPWTRWNNLWTAEEDRHGCALRDYVRDARLFDMTQLERLQYRYIEASFNPEWEHDPYRLLAYTSLQERATQVAHANTARVCGSYEPNIQRILAHISGDEARHYQFYRAVFGGVLERDPNGALKALLKIMPALAMPGHAIAGYEQMSDVVRRAGIYGPRHYQKLVQELLDHWQIGEMTGLSDEGRQTQDKLMQLPRRIGRTADYLESKAHKEREFHFDFLYDRALSV